MVNVRQLAMADGDGTTQRELNQRSWLESVSMCATTKERDAETYLCRPGHPSNPQSVRTGSLDVGGNTGDSKSKLQKSIERKSAKTLTADTPTRLRSDMETFEGTATRSIGRRVNVKGSTSSVSMSIRHKKV